MTRRTLDPKIDVVFKMLFTDERNRDLLTTMLEDFLRPARPIKGVRVLNPELRRENITERGAIVDLLVQLDGGSRVHVEMQLSSHPFFVERALYYWARSHATQLNEGDQYAELQPTAGIFILNYNQLRTERYHTHFQLLETTGHELLTEALDLHFLELPKIPEGQVPDPSTDPVLRWGRFFAAKSDQRLRDLAMSDPILRKASDALERLSDDPIAREEAFKRQLEWSDMQARLEREHQRGIERGIIQAIERLCDSLGIELTAERKETFRNVTPDQLLTLLERLSTTRTW